ncbi:hypothetical protein, partial [Gemmatimonas sp.]|uniref:hypothetical protein n=1 Tax=Gemmatimonas sp. TaxID=1962908 RepID=UPI0037BEAE33
CEACATARVCGHIWLRLVSGLSQERLWIRRFLVRSQEGQLQSAATTSVAAALCAFDERRVDPQFTVGQIIPSRSVRGDMLTKLQVAAYLAELRDSADGALHLRGRVEGVANQWRTSGEPVACP